MIYYICKRIFNPRFVSDEATNRRILVKQLVHSGIIFENDEYSQIGWLDFVMLLFKYPTVLSIRDTVSTTLAIKLSTHELWREVPHI